MKKISVKICTGTLCYVMGGSELQLLEDHLSEEVLAQVDIQGSPCLDCCNREDSAKAPFVKVNERIVSEASITKVVEVIVEELKAQRDGGK